MQITFRRVLSGLLTLLLLLAALTAIFWRQEAYDWWRLRDYQPSAEVSALATATTMTDKGRHIFYVTHPSVIDAETFNQNCNIEEFSIILGCYIEGGNIYIYDISDERLSGIKEVTAAHEMLHAAYGRLSAEERAQLDSQLVSAYKNLRNQRIKAAIAQYQSADPSVVPNELHSILGTEVRDLPQELESYYQRYFANRQKVVSYSDRYEAVFSSRQNQVTQIDKQLESLKVEIERGQAELGQLNAQLTTQRQQLDQLRSSQQTAQYNASVDSYNQLVEQYNALATTTKQQVEDYNRLVKQRNSLVVEVKDLMQAIDSTPEQIR